MTSKVDEFLEHYGVKGMRWGVRKSSKRESRKARKLAEVRRKNKEQEDRINNVIRRAFYEPNVRVNLNNERVMSGKEFTEKFFSGQIRVNADKTSIVEDGR